MDYSFFYKWDISPYLINNNIVSIRIYSVLFGLGIFFVYFNVVKNFYGDKKGYLEDLLFKSIIVMILFSRIFHCFFYNIDYYSQNILEVLIPYNFESGYFTGYQGLSSHGGAIGFVASIIYFGKKKFNKSEILKILDISFFYSLILIFLIRLGNLFNSEILGKYCTKFFCIVFPSYDNLPRYPAQIIEGISYFLLFLIFYILKERLCFLSKPGFLSIAILFSVSLIRFCVEFIKLPNTQLNTGIFNMAQYLTLIISFIIGFILIARKR